MFESNRRSFFLGQVAPPPPDMTRHAARLSGPNMEDDRNNLCAIRIKHKEAPKSEKPNWENSFQAGVKAYANKHFNGSLPDALLDLLKNCPQGGTAIMDLVPAKWWEQPKKMSTPGFQAERSNRYSYYPPPAAPVTPLPGRLMPTSAVVPGPVPTPGVVRPLPFVPTATARPIAPPLPPRPLPGAVSAMVPGPVPTSSIRPLPFSLPGPLTTPGMVMPTATLLPSVMPGSFAT